MDSLVEQKYKNYAKASNLAFNEEVKMLPTMHHSSLEQAEYSNLHSKKYY